MKKNRTQKTLAPMLSDPALEEKAQQRVEQPSTALTVKPPAQLEEITNKGKKRVIARNPATGKMMKRTEATAALLTKEACDFATAKSEQDATLTNAQIMRKHMLETVLATKDPKALIGMARVYQSLIQESTGAQQLLEEAIKEQNREKTTPFSTVYIPIPVLLNSEVLDYEEQQRKLQNKTRPTFAEGEVVQQNPKSNLDTVPEEE